VLFANEDSRESALDLKEYLDFSRLVACTPRTWWRICSCESLARLAIVSGRYPRRVASRAIPARKGSMIVGVNLTQPVKVLSAEQMVVSTSLQWVVLPHT